MDESGSILLKPSLSYISSYSDNGLAVFRDENGKWGYLDQNGRVAIEPVYDQAGTFGSGPLAPVQKDGLCGAIRADGTTAVQLKYQNIGTFTSCN